MGRLSKKISRTFSISSKSTFIKTNILEVKAIHISDKIIRYTCNCKTTRRLTRNQLDLLNTFNIVQKFCTCGRKLNIIK